MSMIDWAKREVEIACKKENPNRKNDEFDYGCACYESALKAYESLCGDGHSGTSISITKHILNRLIEGKVLTPIEDTDDVWNECTHSKLNEYKTYQCKRMSSLFKDVYPDGTIKYHDVNRIVCVDVNNEEITYHNGFISNMMHELFPITMPYMPDAKPYKVWVEDSLYDPKNGDFDTLFIFKYETPDGDFEYVDKYFKEAKNGWAEIGFNEWYERTEGAKK